MLNQSVISAVFAAILFGASTPLAKLLVGNVSPVLLSGLLYLGSGIGLGLYRVLRDTGWKPSGIQVAEWPWLLGAIFFGGIVGPVALMYGLTTASGSAASLMLNLESVLTACWLGWCSKRTLTSASLWAWPRSWQEGQCFPGNPKALAALLWQGLPPLPSRACAGPLTTTSLAKCLHPTRCS